MGAERVLSLLDEWGIEWVDLQFVDLLGFLRHVTVHKSLIDEKALERGLGKLDGSSVKGFTEIQESDLVLKPIPDTLAKLPEHWANGGGVARFLCSVYLMGGRERLSRDPRLALENAVAKLAEEGFESYMSYELEFFVFEDVDVTLDSYRASVSLYSQEFEGSMLLRKKDAYYKPVPHDTTFAYATKLSEVLRSNFGIEVTVFHHEVASGGQMEINFRHADPVKASDYLVTLKYAARNEAYSQGLVAVFLPKPIPDDNGSGLHTHVSLWRNGRNAFHDPNDPYAGLSQTARYFIGGLLEHARALAALTNPTVNSYRRLIPGYEAPVYLVWSKANRSAAVRIPVYFKEEEATKRIEYRPPDPAVNPYLAAAGILMAGLDGIKKKIDPGDPIDENVYKMTPERRRQLGIKSLPRTLYEALDELESDMEWLLPAMPKEAIEAYIELKREEAARLAAYPSPAEFHYYLDL